MRTPAEGVDGVRFGSDGLRDWPDRMFEERLRARARGLMRLRNAFWWGSAGRHVADPHD
jgi:hypothetical protein